MGETRDNIIANLILRKVMKEGDFEFTRKQLARLAGVTQGHLFSQKRHFPGAEYGQKILKKNIVGLLYLSTGTDLDNFLLEKSIEAEQLSQIKESERYKYFTRDYRKEIRKYHEKQNVEVKVLNLPLDPNSHNYASSYTKEILHFYEDAQSSIEVVETLFKGNNKNPSGNLKGYREAHAEIFGVIQDKLESLQKIYHRRSKSEKKEIFTYKRVLCLSPSESIHLKNEPEEQIKAFLIESSPEVLDHIKTCLNKYPDFCEFYISPFTRFRHQCLIDEEVILTEDYIKELDCIVPDEIFIDYLNGHSKSELVKLMEVFKKLFKRKDKIKIIADTISYDSLSDLMKELDNRRKGKQLVYDSFREKLQAMYSELRPNMPRNEMVLIIKELKNLSEYIEDSNIALKNQYRNLGEKIDLLYSE